MRSQPLNPAISLWRSGSIPSTVSQILVRTSTKELSLRAMWKETPKPSYRNQLHMGRTPVISDILPPRILKDSLAGKRCCSRSCRSHDCLPVCIVCLPLFHWNEDEVDAISDHF